MNPLFTSRLLLLTVVLNFISKSDFSLSLPMTSSEYLKIRSQLIDENESRRLGSHLVLSSSELFVNNIFMKEKKTLIESSRLNKTVFFPTESFYKSKRLIDESYLFELIHKMPKGAALHTHDLSMVSLDWIIHNATYRENVYMCIWKQSYLFKVFKTQPLETDCHWKLVSKERQNSKDVQAFDMALRNNLSLVSADPFLSFQDNQAAWLRFGRYFRQVGQLLYYIPIFKDLLWQTMIEFREANVQFIEVRVTYFWLYDLNGKVYDREYCVKLVKEVSDKFVQHFPDFSGMKIIFSGIRFQNVTTILNEIKDVMALHKKYPDVMAGYDLSGNEALYNPFSYYSEALLYPSQQDPPYHLPYFLHAGETNWQGTETGYNLIDALLLNATRVGHAYALSKHPHLMKLYKERDIPLEVQPLSNQVLRLVSDFRNHPMASLIASNYSIVISCDDRTTMDSAPLSHDFYIVFIAMSSDKADLTLLKQLAINSIRFSTLNNVQKVKAMKLWQIKWNTFITDLQKMPYIRSTSTTKVVHSKNSSTPLHWPSWAFISLVIAIWYHSGLKV
ncbi:adenosine deaminase AGSA-like isoform X1 [Biomphalaria glabrata]|uniref:adenosine deaminase n=1 Tax=Biomphalaria glabrata TaxID=6526 RepID=A0A9W3BLN0_BIOGL|nr:adenosine deaminase AGSA-like isoform X1 [Biomphalaria glabrata]XP_055900361.1 adenosine deaminase AGSA-like isoform X1 [Biomphalaria glabrata]